MKDRTFLVFKALLALVFCLSLLSLYPGLSLPVFYLIPLLSLALLVMAYFLERRCKKEQAAYASLKSENFFCRCFRHELLNHLQIIICLSQLGQQKRLQKALWCLSEKLKIFGEINMLDSPALVQALGDFIFSLPAESPFSYTYDLSLEEKDSISKDAAPLVTFLAEILKNRKISHVSLEISRKMDVHLLEIAAAVTGAEELQKSLMAENPLWNNFLRVEEEETDGSGLVFCSIPLTEPSAANEVLS